MINKLATIVLMLSGLTVVVLLAALYWPVKVIVPKQQPYRVLTTQVKRGGNLVYTVDACKYFDTTATVSRVFVGVKDQIQYPALSSQTNVAVGCGKSNISTLVPLFLPKGTYYMVLYVSYHINFARDAQYTFKTDMFQVQ
jgi:hypothetical protein